MTAASRASTRRLGFAADVMGRPDLKDHDGRRWRNDPHPRVNLAHLDRISDYLAKPDTRMHRMSSETAPYPTHSELPRFHDQIDEGRDELAALGEEARRLGLRSSMHPAQYIMLDSPKQRVAEASARDYAHYAAFLDALGMGPEAKIVTHVRGVNGGRAAADRFAQRHLEPPDSVGQRLVLENDEVSWSAGDVLAAHERTGVPLVFDNLHHQVDNPAGWGADAGDRVAEIGPARRFHRCAGSHRADRSWP